MASVTRYAGEVVYKKNGYRQRKPFTQLSVSGGVVNTYRALQMAEELSRKK